MLRYESEDTIRLIRVRGAEARRLVEENRVLVLDVRKPEEFAHEALPGALNAPWPHLKRPASVLDRDTPILVYCEQGFRSRKAAEVLLAIGFTTVYDLGAMRNYYAD